jgi:hypothetical protein
VLVAVVAAVVPVVVDDACDAGGTTLPASTLLARISAFVVGVVAPAVAPLDVAAPVAVDGVELARPWPSANPAVVRVVALVMDLRCSLGPVAGCSVRPSWPAVVSVGTSGDGGAEDVGTTEPSAEAIAC